MLIHTNAAKDVIVLPAEIVNTDRNGDFCYVVEDGVVVMRRIVTGISSDTMVEVTEGLREGDQVVYDMTGTVTEGMNVTAVPEVSAGETQPAETQPEAAPAVETQPEAAPAGETQSEAVPEAETQPEAAPAEETQTETGRTEEA